MTEPASPLSGDAAAQRGTALPLPEGNFQAYLFDCDGTIVDSMPMHYRAWRSVLDPLGCPFPEELFYEWGGVPVDAIARKLADRYKINLPVEELVTRKEQLYRDGVGKVIAIPEVVAHVESQYGRLPLAVVSGGERKAVEKSLRAVGLIDRFETLVCAEDYTHSKPHPEPYLTAAQRLGIEPASCLVFEDTNLGIASARAAGMAWVKVPSPQERAANFH